MYIFYSESCLIVVLMNTEPKFFGMIPTYIVTGWRYLRIIVVGFLTTVHILRLLLGFEIPSRLRKGT